METGAGIILNGGDEFLLIMEMDSKDSCIVTRRENWAAETL
jgi:hypothetical protein